jgi:hypothetical protein
MRSAGILLAILLSPSFAGRCSAQYLAETVQLMPTIQLSNEETTKAKQVTRDLTNAQGSSKTAKARWDQFETEFKQAHPELRGAWPRFSSNFAAAYVIFGDTNSVAPTATTVELSTDERHKAQALYDELKSSDEAVKSAYKNWGDFQNELIVKHIQGVVPKSVDIQAADSVSVITLPDGRKYIVPSPWWRGIALTPDFRTAVPR